MVFTVSSFLQPEKISPALVQRSNSRKQSDQINIMAEREGFEPSVEYNPHTRLAGEHLQPLGHLSKKNGCL